MTCRLLYDTASAAKMLSTSEQRIDELRAGGHLPWVLDGDAPRFKHEDLRTYVDSLPVTGPTSAQPQDDPAPLASAPLPPDEEPPLAVKTPWLTAGAAAAYATVSSWTIRQAVKNGDLPSYAVGKGGRSYRLKAEDVDRWLECNPHEPR